MENSPVGDSRANGAAERVVEAVEEQVRVVRHGLEMRLRMKISGKHPVVCWLLEHADDLLSKYQVGEDCKTGHQSTGTAEWSLVRRCTIASKGQLDKKSCSPDGLKVFTGIKCGALERRSSASRVTFTNLG